jgi:toxin CptA
MIPGAQPDAAAASLKLDAPFYTEDELDALYENDPVLALRISREQARLRKQLESVPDPGAPAPTEEGVREALDEARRILLRDGGDLEFVSLEGAVVTVRLKGACVGCPRGPLDLKQVVAALVRKRYPQITEVRNVY